MKFTFISDTHGKHGELRLPGGDVLIHCGDALNHGTLEELEDFLAWVDYQARYYSSVIYVPGNHDICLDEEHDTHLEESYDACEMVCKSKVILLLNVGMTLGGVRFQGQSWTIGRREKWAFSRLRDEPDMIEKRQALLQVRRPDILITHSPGRELASTRYYLPAEKMLGHSGCADLANVVDELKPKIHAFGHLHLDGGKQLDRKHTLHINAACLDDNYDLPAARRQGITVNL